MRHNNVKHHQSPGWGFCTETRKCRRNLLNYTRSNTFIRKCSVDRGNAVCFHHIQLYGVATGEVERKFAEVCKDVRQESFSGQNKQWISIDVFSWAHSQGDDCIDSWTQFGFRNEKWRMFLWKFLISGIWLEICSQWNVPICVSSCHVEKQFIQKPSDAVQTLLCSNTSQRRTSSK